MVGDGEKNGGTLAHKKNRYDVLERLRRIGNLSLTQQGQWEWFKTHLDSCEASTRGTCWGQVFAETTEYLFGRLLQGDEAAFSHFMKTETERVLGGTCVLVAHGIQTTPDM